MDKTLLFIGFRSRTDRRFFEKRVDTSVFWHSSRQTIGSKSAKNAMFYMGFGTGKHHASEKLETTLPAAGSTVAKKRAEIKHGSPKHGSRTGKHHASEGQRSHKGAPKKTLTSPLKLSKRARNDIASTVAKKTHRKADTAAQNMAPGQGNTMPVKDGEATKKRRKSP